jgi:hypothetical protein
MAPIGECGRRRHAQAQVAQHAAPTGRRERHGHDAEAVEMLVPGGHGAAGGKRKGTRQIEEGEQTVIAQACEGGEFVEVHAMTIPTTAISARGASGPDQALAVWVHQ